MVPSDLGYVNQTVNAADVNKCAELGQTLYSTFDDLSFSQLGHNLLFIGFEFFFQHFFGGKNNLAVLAVQFFHFYAQRAAFVVAEIFNEVTFNHGCRNESARADIGYETAFDNVSHSNFERFLGCEVFFEVFPRFFAVNCTFGEHQAFLVIVDADNFAFYFLSNFNRCSSVVQLYGRQFANRNYAVVFISNAYISLVIFDFDDCSFHGIAFFQRNDFQTFLASHFFFVASNCFCSTVSLFSCGFHSFGCFYGFVVVHVCRSFLISSFFRHVITLLDSKPHLFKPA
ncbi:hypothetical protein D3C73_427620 [compost metagenome]